MNPETTTPKYPYFAAILIVGFVCAIGYLGYQNFKLTKDREALAEELAKTKQEFATQSQNLLENIDAVKQILAAT